MKKPHSGSSKRWKYTKKAKKPRYCESCCMPLKLEEAFLCHQCYAELIRDIPEEEDETD